MWSVVCVDLTLLPSRAHSHTLQYDGGTPIDLYRGDGANVWVPGGNKVKYVYHGLIAPSHITTNSNADDDASNGEGAVGENAGDDDERPATSAKGGSSGPIRKYYSFPITEPYHFREDIHRSHDEIHLVPHEPAIFAESYPKLKKNTKTASYSYFFPMLFIVFLVAMLIAYHQSQAVSQRVCELWARVYESGIPMQAMVSYVMTRVSSSTAERQQRDL